MSCSNFEQGIALYVEDDLSAVERRKVEAHLQACSSCWDLAEDLKESQALFKSFRQDIPNASALSFLRERVLDQVGGLERLSWFERILFGGLRRKAALAGILMIVVGGGTMWLTRRPAALAPAPGVQVASNREPADVPIPIAERQAVAPPRSTVHRGVHSQSTNPPSITPAEEPRQVTIKLVTDDPKVIIYWLVDEKGD